MNLTDFLNSTKNVQIYVEPARDRDKDPESGYNKTDLNLTWSIDNFDGKNLLVDNKFNNPLKVSPLLE